MDKVTCRTIQHQGRGICKRRSHFLNDNCYVLLILGWTWPWHVLERFTQRICLWWACVILTYSGRVDVYSEKTLWEHHHGVLIMRSQARLKEELNLERCAHVLTGLIMNASPAFHVIRHLWKVYMLAALWYHIVPGLHGALPAPALTRPHFLLLFFHTCGWHEHLHLSRLMKHTVFYFTYLFSDAGKVIYSTFCI